MRQGSLVAHRLSKEFIVYWGCIEIKELTVGQKA